MSLYRFFVKMFAIVVVGGIGALFWANGIHHPTILAGFTGAGCLVGLFIGDKDPSHQRISFQLIAELITFTTVIALLVTVFYFVSFSLYDPNFPPSMSEISWYKWAHAPLFLFGFLFPSFFLPFLRGRRVTI